MVTIAALVAGSWLGFRLGARYQTITNMGDAARAKINAWLGRV